MGKKKKSIRTKSLNRFLKSEYKEGIASEEIKSGTTYEEFTQDFKKEVNTCRHCGTKFWGEPRCKCDLI